MVCTPPAQAAKNADSLRVLPTVRRQLAGTRKEARGLEGKLALTQSQLFDVRQDLRTAQREGLELRNMVLAEVELTKQYKAKARRRGWVVAGLVAVLGGLTYVGVAL